ncbi:MAG: SapC family protein [Proteobacteria bacterium]|nr:multidrug transporter [Pseudomonadota bacterium]NOG59042.1 SapC family protein [Pseudomonadota bacterium]
MTKNKSGSHSATSIYPLFYKKVVPLNKESHSELYIEGIEGYTHTKETNSVYIAAIEFIQIAKEYPIVFAKGADDKVFPVALLGLEKNQNLFVDNEGAWTAEYIPAYVRRYPFILATPNEKESTFAVCIDESYPGFNTAKEGKPLFDEKGQQLDILSQAIEFLKDYQAHVQLTVLFCENLSTLDLLEPMQANIEFAGGEKSTLGGFMGVSREKLKSLKPAQFSELVKSDQMELIYAHLASLSNMNDLIKRRS